MALKHAFLIIALASVLTQGQTRVDLGAQGKDVNFTTAPSTLPFKAGTALPPSCQPAELFFKVDALAGTNIYGCTGNNTWTNQTGTLSVTQSLDLGVTWSANTLSIGAGCSINRPCNVRFGNTVHSLQTGATATISSGSGLAFIFISSAGALTVGHNLAITCSVGCTAQSGVSGFPADSIPLFTWSATLGVWDSAGGVDVRALLSTANTIAGLGLLSTNTLGLTTVSVDPTMVSVRVAAPSSATSACSAGYWAFDSDFFYVCVDTDTWKRVGVATW